MRRRGAGCLIGDDGAVSTLIPREAGCDVPRQGSVPAHAIIVSTLIPREAGCDRRASVSSSFGEIRFNPHPARGGMRLQAELHRARGASMFQPSSRARRDATFGVSSRCVDAASGFNPHPARGGMRPAQRCLHLLIGQGVSTLIPREAGCDVAEITSWRRRSTSFNPHPARGGMRRTPERRHHAH